MSVDPPRRRAGPGAAAALFVAVLLGLWLVRSRAEARWVDTATGLVLALGAAALSGLRARADREARGRLAEQLRQRSAMLASILDGMGDGCLVLDCEGRLLVINAAARRLFGEDPKEQLVPEWPLHLKVFPPDQPIPYPRGDGPLARAARGEAVDVRMAFVRAPMRPEGLWISVSARPLLDAAGAVQAGVAMVRDVTDQKRAEDELSSRAERLRALSQVDELTGLLNRRGFLALAEQRLAAAAAGHAQVAVLFADLDGLKRINDTLGHEAGDAAIKDMAGVLRRSLREGDVVARLGGDEFAALVAHKGPQELPHLEARVKANAQALSGRDGRAYEVRASLGFALFDPARPGTTTEWIEELLKQADARMYERKKAAKAERKA